MLSKSEKLSRQSRESDFSAALKRYDLWLTLGWHDIKIRYRRSGIGPFWITLSMAIFCIALGIVYSQLFKANIFEYLPFLSAGFVVWFMISGMLGEAPNIFVDNAAYLKDIRINLMSVILRVFTRNSIIFAHNSLILIGIYLYFGINPGFTILLFVPAIILVLANLLAVTVILSIIGARFRDISPINQSLIQIMFFITPIMWFPRMVPADSWLLKVNPLAYLLDLARSPLLGEFPKNESWIVAVGTLAVATFIASIIYRAKAQRISFWV